MSYRVDLTYFKLSGKYYSEGSYVSDKAEMHEIFDEVEIMIDAGKLPGLVEGAKEFYVHAVVPCHPHDHPCLFVPAAVKFSQKRAEEALDALEIAIEQCTREAERC